MREGKEERSRSIPDSVCLFANGSFVALFLAEAGLYKSIFSRTFPILRRGYLRSATNAHGIGFYGRGDAWKGECVAPLLDQLSFCVVNFKEQQEKFSPPADVSVS